MPNVLIAVRFNTAAEGGRASDLKAGPYSCPMFIGNAASGFDCRVLVDEAIARGKWYFLHVQFLDPARAMSRMTAYDPIKLWESKVIANGVIIEVL